MWQLKTMLRPIYFLRLEKIPWGVTIKNGETFHSITSDQTLWFGLTEDLRATALHSFINHYTQFVLDVLWRAGGSRGSLVVQWISAARSVGTVTAREEEESGSSGGFCQLACAQRVREPPGRNATSRSLVVLGEVLPRTRVCVSAGV